MAQSKRSFDLVTETKEEDEWELKMKKIRYAVGTMVVHTSYIVAKAATLHEVQYIDRSMLAQRDEERNLLMERLTRQGDSDCREQLRMGVDAFARLCQLLRETTRLHTRRSSVEEQVAKLLQIVSHNWKNRSVKFYFTRSGETVSRHFHKVLKVIISLEDHFSKQPDGSKVPLEIQNNPRFMPYFKHMIIFVRMRFEEGLSLVCQSNGEKDGWN